MRLSLPPQYSRLLLGVVLGFILGTVLYQSQRREWNVRGQVAPPSNSCQIPQTNSSCPSGWTPSGNGNDCYAPYGAPCTAVNNVSGICEAGNCNPITRISSSSSCGATYPVSCTGLLGQFCCPVGDECVDTNTPQDGFPDICGPAQCAALGTACGTSVMIPCDDGTFTGDLIGANDTRMPNFQPTPTCPGSGNYCTALPGQTGGNCHVYKTLSCCAGSTCDSNTNTCVDLPDYCCNTSNYMCYPSSSSSSSSSCITVGNGGCTTPADCCSTSARPLFCDFGANSSSSTGYCNDRPSSSSSSSCITNGNLSNASTTCCSGLSTVINGARTCVSCLPVGEGGCTMGNDAQCCGGNSFCDVGGYCNDRPSSSTSPSSVGSTSSSCANINSHCGGDTSDICCDQNAECTQRPGIGFGCCFPDGTTLPIDGTNPGNCCSNQTYSSNGNTICGVSSSSAPSSVGSSATSTNSTVSSITSSSCSVDQIACGNFCCSIEQGCTSSSANGVTTYACGVSSSSSSNCGFFDYCFLTTCCTTGFHCQGIPGFGTCIPD